MCGEEPGGYGCATCLCTVKPTPPFVSVASTIEGVLEAIPALGQARKEGSIAKSYMKVRNEGTMSYMQARKNDSRSF